MTKLLESNQIGECFDCDEEKPLYAVQRIASVDMTNGKATKEWNPLCKDCYELHHGIEALA